MPGDAVLNRPTFTVLASAIAVVMAAGIALAVFRPGDLDGHTRAAGTTTGQNTLSSPPSSGAGVGTDATASSSSASSTSSSSAGSTSTSGSSSTSTTTAGTVGAAGTGSSASTSSSAGNRSSGGSSSSGVAAGGLGQDGASRADSAHPTTGGQSMIVLGLALTAAAVILRRLSLAARRQSPEISAGA